jgi:molybdenum cofactor cytidylyltransferase
MPTPDHPEVTAIVLAAGGSTRMGQNKLVLEIGGEAVVRRAVRAAVESGVDDVVVVLGHEAPRVEAELSGLSCRPVVNPDHARGVGTSLRFGITQAATSASAIVVVLADMPFVSASMIGTVVERYRTTGAPLVVSQYGDVEAPPNLYDRSLFEELLSVPDERCGKRVLRRHKHEAVVVTWPEEALKDIDVAEDYERARAQRAGG